MFTEAIEDHLALKKQNAALGAAMPLEAFDVGDPLDRYPGGPVAPAAEDTGSLPSVDQAVAAADETVAGHVVEGGFRPPLQPLSGMTPMLSLVEDVEDEDAVDGSPTLVGAATNAVSIGTEGSVVRFPGGVGPRVEDAWSAGGAAGETAVADAVDTAGAATATAAPATADDFPVIVIDADEPLSNAPAGDLALEPRSVGGERIKRPSFFGGLRRRKKNDDETGGDSWFNSQPRDFNWDD